MTPVIAEVALARLSRMHFARVMVQAPSASVAAHLRRCCSAMVAAGLEEGLLRRPGRAARGALEGAGGPAPR
ncbi:MAG TPA: hypothetical protein VGR26_08810 [Acidimicrobiales bacterium]|nr:hypothetical protein [Acidimicrobiales bacterium]